MSHPRIIAGTAKNKQLQVAEASRPLTGRIKQSLFDTIQPKLAQAKVLDLYAGSGSFGLEALSRGAASAVFVETNHQALVLLRSNITSLGFSSTTRVSSLPVDRFLSEYDPNTSPKFDIIFADPPFAYASQTPTQLIAQWLTNNGLFILRLPQNLDPTKLGNPSLNMVLSEDFGESILTYWQLAT